MVFVSEVNKTTMWNRKDGDATEMQRRRSLSLCGLLVTEEESAGVKDTDLLYSVTNNFPNIESEIPRK